MGCVKINTPENDLKDHYMRQVARGKPRLKALVSTMGKLAEIVYHCLKAGEPYHYQGIYRWIEDFPETKGQVSRHIYKTWETKNLPFVTMIVKTT